MIARRQRAFTVIELLVVMAVIIVLAGLILGTSSYVQKKGARSRAKAEIAAMSAALESYKADNGIYPRGNAALSATTPFDTDKIDARRDGSPSKYASATLYLCQVLAGMTPAGTSNAQFKSYIAFKPNQLARSDMSQPVSASNPVTALRDPFGNSYGYSTAFWADSEANPSTAPSRGYNPTFDLWSTGGLMSDPPQSGVDTITPQWIKNW